MSPQAKIQAAVASVLMLGFAAATFSAPVPQPKDTEKCYGVALGGKNDCGTAKHACAGQGARVDKDPSEWKYVANGTCVNVGGQTQPPGNA